MTQPVQPENQIAPADDGADQLIRQSADLRLLRRVRQELAAYDDLRPSSGLPSMPCPVRRATHTSAPT